jgi:2-(1,2-epoxy-1,2-dihydrophenyl)acetyl-CoA isomerase
MAPKEFENLLYEVHDSGTLVITLNRPDKLNAFDDALSFELVDALKQAEKDKQVRCILLTGAGRGFCAGQDLQSRSIAQNDGESPHLGESIRNRYLPIIHKLRTLEKPIVCAINGVAAGAGASVAFACDYRLASEQASFIQAFIKVGLIPDSGACFLLPRLIGLGRAMDLMMTGRKVEAQEALEIGLVSELCAPEQLMERAMQVATQFSHGPTKAFGLLKRATNQAMNVDLETYLHYEADLQEVAGWTQDYQEGVSAFMEKRPPAFCGR